MNTHIPYYRNPCQNSSAVSYRPIQRVTMYSMNDLCKAFAEGQNIELEGLKGVIVGMRQSYATPGHMVVSVNTVEYSVCECLARIK